MSISQSMTDWTKCLICQKKTKEKLRSTDEGGKSLAALLSKFSTKNALSFDIKRIQKQLCGGVFLLSIKAL